LKLALGSDHGGLELKNIIKEYIHKTRPEIQLNDLGTYNNDSVDYPDYGKKVAKSILDGENEVGIICCGTGIGISMAANRYKGIRAALVFNEFTAQMAKEHNNANIISMGGRTTEPELAKKLVDIWLDKEFEGGRHQNRLDKIES
jgi:ribose 5-phosphate isomerase B